MTEPVGIAQVVHSLEVGGMERVALHLATGMDRKRFRPVIVCLSIRGDFADAAEREGIEVIALGKEPGVDLSLPFKIAKLLRQRRIRLVHAHNSGPFFSGTLAAKIGRLGPVVVTDHSRPYPERMRVRLTEWALSPFVTIVSVSKENKDRLAENLWISPKRIRVIPNGVMPAARPNEDRLAKLRGEFGLRKDDHVFVCVARLEPQKSLDVLLDSARIMKERGFRGRVLIVGTGSMESCLRRKAHDAGLDDVVTLTGKRLDVADLYHLAGAFVLSSQWEGLPMSALEAMSAGLPVVTTRVGDLPDVVEEGASGFLVASGDPAALADAMARVCATPGLCEKLGRRGRELFELHFSIGHMVRNYEKLYEELL